MPHQQIACARLFHHHLMQSSRTFSVTFTTSSFSTPAAYGSLKSAPTSRFRRTSLHLRYSTVPKHVLDTTPHRPVRALLAHTVLTSDVRMFGAETCIGIGVQDLDWWQQRFQAGHKALPAHAMSLASAPQRLQPAPQHVIAKRSQPRQVARCGVILEVPPHHLLQPFHGSRYACVQALAQLYSYFFELRCHALTDRLPTNREFTRLVVRPTNVGET